MSLVAARYGKDLVRVLRVVRHKPNENGNVIHDIVEYNVRALVEGDISSRNLTFVFDQTDGLDTLDLAKTSPHVLSPELFATHVGAFLLDKYEHLNAAFVDIEMLKWSRLAVGEHGVDGVQGSSSGQGHRHSFQRDGEDKHIVNVEVTKSDNGIMSVKVTAGLCDLLLLKSSGSAFSHFIRDEFTTLVEVKDRILSTAVNLQYDFPKYTLKNGLGSIGAMETELEFKKAAELARNVTIDLFTTHDSDSVQATLFKMGEAVIAGHESVEKITYVLPNKHYIPVNLDYLGIANMAEDVAEVFMPVNAPRAEVARRTDPTSSAQAPVYCPLFFSARSAIYFFAIFATIWQVIISVQSALQLLQGRSMSLVTCDLILVIGLMNALIVETDSHAGMRYVLKELELSSDLLSRHVNKCHASERPATTTQPARRRGHAQPGSSAAAGVSGPAPSLIPPPGTRKICDVCASSRTPAQCDAGLPCGKCLQRNSKCTYIKALETIRRPQATQGINYSRTTDLITPPMTVPSMGLPQRTDPALFPSQPSYNFPASLYSNLQGQSNTSSQSPYFNSNAGNQGSTEQPPNVHGQLPVPAPYPAFIPDHQQQQTPSTMFAPYPATPHTAARAKNELDAYLLENAFGGANSLGGSAAASSSSYLYNNTHAQEFMAPNQHQPGLPHINDHHLGYPGYTPPSTARSVSSHSSQRTHSAHHSPQQQHQAAYSNTADSPASNDSPSYTHSSNISASNNAPSSTAQTQLLDGGVSSAFGMMSLDDPAVAAEMSKSGSFFAPNAFPKTPSALSNNNAAASHIGSTGTGLTPFLGPNFNAKWSSPSLNSSAGLLTPGLGLGFTLGLGNVSSSNASLPSLGSSGLTPFLNGGGNPLDGHFSTGMGNSIATGFTPGRESNIAELKEFWRQFMKTPGEKTPGVGTFGGLGKDGLHNDGSHTDSETSRPRHSLSKVASYPDLKTPGGTNVSQNAHAGNYSMSEKEDLRSYQQAVLARKAPQLTLIPKRRGTLPQTYGDIQAKPGPGNMINNTQTNTSKRNNLIPQQQQVNGSPSPSASSTHSNSDTGSLFTPTQRIVRERPTFKRLASQTLGPFEAKSAKISHQDINVSEGSEDTDGNEDAEWLDVQDSTVHGKTTQNSRQKPQSCAESVNNSSTQRRLAVPEMVALS